MTGVLVPDDRIQAPAPAHPGVGVLGVERGEVGDLEHDAVGVAELLQVGADGVEREPVQQVAQLQDRRVAGGWDVATMAQVHVQGQDQLICDPVRVVRPCAPPGRGGDAGDYGVPLEIGNREGVAATRHADDRCVCARWRRQYSSKSPLLITARRVRMASVPCTPHRAAVMSSRSPTCWRRTPLMTPAAIGQPAARAWSCAGTRACWSGSARVHRRRATDRNPGSPGPGTAVWCHMS